MAKKKPAEPVVAPVVETKKEPRKRKSRAKVKEVKDPPVVKAANSGPKTCPYYKGVVVMRNCTAHGWTLCLDCDGQGNLGGRSLEEIQKETASYSRHLLKPNPYRV